MATHAGSLRRVGVYTLALLAGVGVLAFCGCGGGGGGEATISLTITAPAAGDDICPGDLVRIVATVSATNGVDRVVFSVDGRQLDGADRTAPWIRRWDTADVVLGDHTISVVAYDGSTPQRQAGATVNVTVVECGPTGFALYFAPEMVSVRDGEELTARVHLSGAQDIAGCRLRCTFDPQHLELVGGANAVQPGAAVPSGADAPVVNTSVAGEVFVLVASPRQPFDANETEVLTIRFRASAGGRATTAIAWGQGLGDVLVADTQGGIITPGPDTSGATVVIGGPRPDVASQAAAVRPAQVQPHAATGPSSFRLGDMNLNAIPDVGDYVTISRIVAGLQAAPPNRYPDASGDGQLTAADYGAVGRAAVGLEAWPMGTAGPVIALDLDPDAPGIQDGYPPDATEPAAGEEVTIDVWAIEVDDLAGFSLEMSIEGAGIQVDSVTQGPFVTSAGGQANFLPTIDGGRISVACSILQANALNSPDGQGVIARLHCTTGSGGQQATIELLAPSGSDPGTRVAHPRPEDPGHPIYEDPARHGATLQVASG